MFLNVLNKNCYLTKSLRWYDVENLAQIVYMHPTSDPRCTRDLRTKKLEPAFQKNIEPLAMRDLNL